MSATTSHGRRDATVTPATSPGSLVTLIASRGSAIWKIPSDRLARNEAENSVQKPRPRSPPTVRRTEVIARRIGGRALDRGPFNDRAALARRRPARTARPSVQTAWSGLGGSGSRRSLRDTLLGADQSALRLEASVDVGGLGDRPPGRRHPDGARRRPPPRRQGGSGGGPGGGPCTPGMGGGGGAPPPGEVARPLRPRRRARTPRAGRCRRRGPWGARRRRGGGPPRRR